MTFGVAGSEGRFQVFAHVQSTRRHWGVTFKTDVDEAAPRVDSWVPVYPGADWHERECWEMFGFDFDGHPGIRHLYLPSEFEGHPLRKDYQLLARSVKPWPGLVDVEPMLGDDDDRRRSGRRRGDAGRGRTPWSRHRGRRHDGYADAPRSPRSRSRSSPGATSPTRW